MEHRARKRFGQHFLHDEGVVDQLVRAIAPQRDDRMVEIGPGMAALTAPLLDRLEHLTVLEIDRDLAQHLRSLFPETRLRVIEQDALSFDYASLGPGLRVVGNLPYNISSPLLFHLTAYADVVIDQHFMLQREVVERMTAAAGSSAYGRLSVMLQARYRMQQLFDVDPGAFDPPPRVMSSVVRMQPLPADRPRPVCEALFAALVAQVFGQRRKMLRRSLGACVADIDWAATEVVPTARPQELSVAQFMQLADHLHTRGVTAAQLQPKNQ